MSLLDEKLDIIPKDIIQEKIKSLFNYSISNQKYQMTFIRCNWDKIIKELDKYYIYTNCIYDTIYIRIDKINKSLKGNFGGSDGEYILLSSRSLKHLFEL